MKTLEVHLTSYPESSEGVDTKATLRNATGFFSLDLIDWLTKQPQGAFRLRLRSTDLTRAQLEALSRLALNAMYSMQTKVLEAIVEADSPPESDIMLQQLRGDTK